MILFLSTMVLGKNMNPIEYFISNPLAGHEGQPMKFIGNYFEVKSPVISDRYASVYWTTMDAVPLPPEIVSRYNNSVIAITGFESNLMRINSTTGLEESVPCYDSYNHHYVPNIASSKVKVKRDKQGRVISHSHRGPDFELIAPHTPNIVSRPPIQLVNTFVHGNGNEHRQMYHGAAPPFVQLIESPANFIFSPMQINLNDGSGKRGSGPLPTSSLAPPGAPWSGLIECPCTTRSSKVFPSLTTAVTGACKELLDQDLCFTSATSLVSVEANVTISNGSLPAGCFLDFSSASSAYTAIFNTFASRASCSSTGTTRLQGTRQDLCALTLDLDIVNQVVTLTLTGPSDVWFGFGFDATSMADTPYTIVVDGVGAVTERKLADHAAGSLLDPTLKLMSNTIKEGLRTVVLQRALAGAGDAYYSFSPDVASIPYINAIGATVDFQQHAQRAGTVINLVSDTITCICQGQGGTINGVPFNADCKPEPLSDLLAWSNPTCELASYSGGLSCCGHEVIILDADQEQPIFEQEVFFKFRFYYQDYKETIHRPIYHIEWSINGCDSNGPPNNAYSCSHIEFDVPKTSSPLSIFQSTFTVADMLSTSCTVTDGSCMDIRFASKGIDLVMLASHCHAPNCILEELVDLDSNITLCSVKPVRGSGDEAFNELGYLSTVACVWGAQEDGFEPPPTLSLKTKLQLRATYDSTSAHYGQMGILQMKAAYSQ